MKRNNHRIQNSRIQDRLRVVFMASLLFVNVSTVGTLAQRTAKKPQPGKAGTLVAVVSRAGGNEAQGNMDAVVLVEDGKLLQPYPEYNEAAQRKFASQYFASGKRYSLTFGGGGVGSATIKGSDMGCNNIHATATVEDNGKVPAGLPMLAQSSDLYPKEPSSRRTPTDAERAAINLLVTQIYRSHGATRAVLRTVVITNLTATDLDGDGELELIGSYTAESKTKARKDLLLIAEPAGTGFKPALVKFQAYKLPPEGFDSAIDFVDQLDLDGDGVGEVFVQQHGFDAYGYAIYKRLRGTWRQIYTTTGDAC
jgi:hypothetical protein